MRDSGQMLQVMHSGMVKAGLDVQKIYARLGYDAEQLPLRELRTAHQMQTFFWETLESVTGDREIGLHLCPHLPVYRGEVLEYLLFSSRTFGEGVSRALKYLRLISDALHIRLVREEKTVCIHLTSAALDAPVQRHTEICMLYELVQLVYEVTEQQFRPIEVALSCAPRAPAAEFEKLFGCPVQFSADIAKARFDLAVLDYRSPHWDPDLLQLHEEFAAKRLSKIERQDLIERIRAVFARRLEIEQCELEDVASELGMPPRRLRFELTRAGTSFSQLRSDFRFALARRLLAQSDEPIENIVYLTGFSEPSTFYRAFKRWAGMTPLQYREQRRRPATAEPTAR